MILPAEPNVQANSTDDPQIGTIVAERYRILEVVGHGGMGVVYKAEHVHISRVFALKMLLREAASTDQAFKRFQQEARAASLLSHPHIVGIHDFGVVEGGRAYLAMDFLDGISLTSAIHNQGPLPLPRFLHVFSQACDALQHAHQNKVVHRDIKPSNLVLLERGSDRDFLMIVDFGLVKLMSQTNDQKLTSTDMLVGSPLYMSPEQCRGKEVDHRTDIYSLGCCMFEALTGKPPFLGESPLDTLYKHVSEAPLPLHLVNPDSKVPAQLEQLIMKALAKEPQERQQSMAELGQELITALAEHKGPYYVPPVSGSYRAPTAALNDDNSKTSISTPSLPGGVSSSSVHAPSSSSTPGTSSSIRTGMSSSTLIEPLPQAAKKSAMSWLMPALLGCVAIAIIAGLVHVIALQKQELKSEEKEFQKESAEIKSEVSELKSEAEQEVAKKNAPAPAVAAALTHNQTKKALPEVSPEERATKLREKLAAKDRSLRQRADSAFEGENWKEAANLYQLCLTVERELFGARDGHLVVTLAQLTICNWKLRNQDGIDNCLEQFRSLYTEHPQSIAQQPELLRVMFQISMEDRRYPLAENLIRAAIAAHDKEERQTDATSLSMRLNLVAVLRASSQLDAALGTAQQVFDYSQPFPKVHVIAARNIIQILNQQGRFPESKQFQQRIHKEGIRPFMQYANQSQ